MKMYQRRSSTDSGPRRPCTPFRQAVLEVRVERVVQEAGPGHDVRVILPDIREALADGPEAGRLRLRAGLVGKVGLVDDPRESSKCSIAGEALLHELLEGAAAALVLVGIPRARRIEPDRPAPSLELGDLLRFHEEDLRLGIEKAPDEPRGGGAVHMDPLARDPLHRIYIAIDTPHVN